MKEWWQSKGIVGGLLIILAGVYKGVDDAMGGLLPWDWIPTILITLGGGLGIIGIRSGDTPIKGLSKPTEASTQQRERP